MLSSLWQNVVGENDVDPAQVLNEDYATENEDELADKLLTQFPVYGSAEPTATDWLIEEDSKQDEETNLLLMEDSVLGATGGPASPAQQKQHQKQSVLVDWDAEEEGLWRGNSATTANGDSIAAAAATGKRTTPTSLAGVSFYSFSTGAPNNDDNEKPTTLLQTTDDRQHWMPDQLCKQCYACELPFTGMNFWLRYLIAVLARLGCRAGIILY